MKEIQIILAFLLSLRIGVCDAQKLSKNDFDEILKKASTHAIIGLGEAQHFYKGYYDTKIAIVKHLVLYEAIHVIVLEASMNVTAILNDYINGKRTIIDLPQTLTDLNEPYALQEAGLYNCSEIADFIEWLKNYNIQHSHKIKLVGMDFQNYSVPLEKLKTTASASQNRIIDQTNMLLDSSMHAILDSNIMIITSPDWIDRFKSAQNYVSGLKLDMLNAENQSYFTELEQFTTLWDNPSFPRDSLMFENLIPHMAENSRILIWSANFHLENDSDFNGPKKLGVFLSNEYGSDYFIVGISDETDQCNSTLLYPSMDSPIGKYDLLINVPKGEKCVVVP